VVGEFDRAVLRLAERNARYGIVAIYLRMRILTGAGRAQPSQAAAPSPSRLAAEQTLARKASA